MRELSPEEIAGGLEMFPEVFKNLVGKPLNNAQLMSAIRDLLELKEREIIINRFSTYSPKQLRTILNMIKDKSKKSGLDERVPEVTGKPKDDNHNGPRKPRKGPAGHPVIKGG
jgi:hypothetical protein